MKFFKGYTSSLTRFAKTQWTQLQFIFELKNGDIETSYRAYASDEVIEIFTKEHFVALKGKGSNDLLNTKKFNMVPMLTTVNTFKLPRGTVLSRNQEGTIVLPNGIIPPAAFAEEKVDEKTGKK